jgi:hypothetical protein
MLIAKLILGLEDSIINVETAFFHGEFAEEIYMNITEGIIEDQKHSL